MSIKRISRKIIPGGIRAFIWRAIPKIHLVNTYVLDLPATISPLHPIKDKFRVRKVGGESFELLKKAFQYRGKNSFITRVPARLNAPEWVCLAIVNSESGDIAYTGWIIERSIPYLEEFGICIGKNEFLLKDGYCVPDYRHQGLHTRMEQERINYCVNKGALRIYIQIHDNNLKGVKSVTDNGYKLYSQDKVIQWPLFKVFREFSSFLKRPFRKVVK